MSTSMTTKIISFANVDPVTKVVSVWWSGQFNQMIIINWSKREVPQALAAPRLSLYSLHAAKNYQRSCLMCGSSLTSAALPSGLS